MIFSKCSFTSTYCLFHVRISLVTKVSEEELLNWNREFFSCRNSQVWQVGPGLTDPGSRSSDLQPRLFHMRSYLHQKHLRKMHIIIAAGRHILYYQTDNKHWRAYWKHTQHKHSTSQIQYNALSQPVCRAPATPGKLPPHWQLPSLIYKLSTFQRPEV